MKRLGGATDAVRTAEQTQTARLFASVGYSTSVPAVWFNSQLFTRAAWHRHGPSLRADWRDAARSLLTSFSGKFLYGLWRPTTAIREAARDGNSVTEPDSTFVALILMLAYPTIRATWRASPRRRRPAHGRVPTTPPFSVTWTGINQDNVTRSYNSFRQLADEAAASRIYGGIHFYFDYTASIGACGLLGTYIVENAMRPVG